MTNKQLFNKFLAEQLDQCYRFAYMYTNHKQDAEDVVSESVVKALKSISALQNQQYLKTWFYRIMINTAKDLLARRNRTSVGEEYEQAIESQTYDFDMTSDLSFNEMLTALSPESRAIIAMRFCEGARLCDIAQALDLSENTVKTKYYAALKKLRLETEEAIYG